MSKKTYYITTPIYYQAPTCILDILTALMADAMARFKRLTGYDVMFNGTDEHGQKFKSSQ